MLDRFLNLIIIILLIIPGGVGVYFWKKHQNNPSVQTVVTEQTGVKTNKNLFLEKEGVTYLRNVEKDLNIILFTKPFEIVFTPKEGLDLSENIEKNNFKFGINGTYFRGDYFDAEHAGLLQIKGELIEPKGTDAQLSHFVIYDTSENTLDFQPMTEYKKDKFFDKKYTLFQTGPLIMKENVIAADYINNSLNGQGNYLRSTLGYTDRGEIFFLITTTRYSLEDLGNGVKSLELFKNKKVSLINLDGGTSTSMYVKDAPEMNYHENKGLPIVLGVK